MRSCCNTANNSWRDPLYHLLQFWNNFLPAECEKRRNSRDKKRGKRRVHFKQRDRKIENQRNVGRVTF